MLRTLLTTTLIISLPLIFVGCGDSGPRTTPVSITITQQGNPLAGATVTMVSTDGDSAAGMTNDSGVAEMELTGVNKKGALPGEYSVAVRKWDIVIVPNPSEESPDDTRSTRVSLLPDKYGETSTSGFTLTVGTSAVKETFDIPE